MDEDDHDVDGYRAAPVPETTGNRDLMACRRCGLVKTVLQVLMLSIVDDCVLWRLCSSISFSLSFIDAKAGFCLRQAWFATNMDTASSRNVSNWVVVQFQQTGCDNCEPGMGIDIDSLNDVCTTNFSGMIAIMDPENSWCARWTRKRALLGHVRFIYCWHFPRSFACPGEPYSARKSYDLLSFHSWTRDQREIDVN
jgi:RNA polymerase subunit RPABC4/transcription elongation factor Spt4